MTMPRPQHTPGPLSVDNGDSDLYGLFDEAGEFVAYLAEPCRTAMGGYAVNRSQEETRANAERLAAAWNACRFFSTADLESIGVGPYMEVMAGQGDNDGVRLIALERVRQVTQEGWTAEHDDSHSRAEMSMAARDYIEMALDQTLPSDLRESTVNERGEIVGEAVDYSVPETWPWDEGWWKPSTDPIRNLVKAGALIAAEIDRLGREKARGKTETADAR